MAKLKYTGELGQVRRGDRALQPDEVIEVPDHEVEGHLALRLFEDVSTTSRGSSSDETPNPSPAADAADDKE